MYPSKQIADLDELLIKLKGIVNNQ